MKSATPKAIKRVFAACAVAALMGSGGAWADEPIKDGAPLDVSAWQYRKPVAFTDSGIIRVELDPEVLGHSTLDQGDVRVMQGGRQLPYLIERAQPLREVELAFREEPDAKRPSFSRWRIVLPVAGLPVESLEVTSPTELFGRQMNLWEEGRDAQGDPYRRALGTTSWTRKPGASSPLRVSLPSRPTSDALLLETDNGDNPHLQLTTARASYRPVHLVFATTSSSQVELAYGNPRASAPRYDIELIRAQLQNADKANAELGPEVRAAGYKDDRDSIDRIWLWMVLGLVVAGLLWLVARLLPAHQPPPQG